MNCSMTFLNDESGAVTVDWVVLTAATVGLGIAALSVVSGGIADLSGDVDTQLRASSLISTGFMRAFDVAFDILEGVDGIGISTFGNAYVNGSEVRFVQGYGGAAIIFGTDAFAPGMGALSEISTQAVMDWGRHGESLEPFAISFGDQSTVQGSYGTNLGEGVTVTMDPSDSSYAINWNGQEIGSGPVGFDLVNVGGGTYGMSVSEAGLVSVSGLGDTIATATIPGDGWNGTDRSGWELGYATQNDTGLGWMYGRDFEVSGSGM
jgi:hypothetical protein